MVLDWNPIDYLLDSMQRICPTYKGKTTCTSIYRKLNHKQYSSLRSASNTTVLAKGYAYTLNTKS